MRTRVHSFTDFLPSSKKTVLLILIVVVTSISITAAIYILLKLPSVGTLKTLGVEAYWDKNLKNKTETIDWGTIRPGLSENVAFYVRSISNVEATLYLNTTNWNPINISDYMNLSWNYDGTLIQPGEIIEITLTLSTPYSSDLIQYLITNDVREFSFDIIISTSE